MNYGKQTVIIDLIREVTPPFSPEHVCANFARTLQNYNISSISGDRFAGIWPVEQFRKFNIRYEQSAEPKSDLYQSLLPLINSLRIDLLDNPKLINHSSVWNGAPHVAAGTRSITCPVATMIFAMLSPVSPASTIATATTAL